MFGNQKLSPWCHCEPSSWPLRSLQKLAVRAIVRASTAGQRAAHRARRVHAVAVDRVDFAIDGRGLKGGRLGEDARDLLDAAVRAHVHIRGDALNGKARGHGGGLVRTREPSVVRDPVGAFA